MADIDRRATLVPTKTHRAAAEMPPAIRPVPAAMDNTQM
jgi:hypothetical protein